MIGCLRTHVRNEPTIAFSQDKVQRLAACPQAVNHCALLLSCASLLPVVTCDFPRVSSYGVLLKYYVLKSNQIKVFKSWA